MGEVDMQYLENDYKNDVIFALERENIEDLINVFNRLLAENIPPNDFDGTWLYRSSLFAFLLGCGISVQTNNDRADLVIKFGEKYFVLEIKMLPSTAKQALQQIIDNDYAKPYSNAVMLGLAIDGEKRLVAEWELCYLSLR